MDPENPPPSNPTNSQKIYIYPPPMSPMDPADHYDLENPNNTISLHLHRFEPLSLHLHHQSPPRLPPLLIWAPPVPLLLISTSTTDL